MFSAGSRYRTALPLLSSTVSPSRLNRCGMKFFRSAGWTCKNSSLAPLHVTCHILARTLLMTLLVARCTKELKLAICQGNCRHTRQQGKRHSEQAKGIPILCHSCSRQNKLSHVLAWYTQYRHEFLTTTSSHQYLFTRLLKHVKSQDCPAKILNKRHITVCYEKSSHLQIILGCGRTSGLTMAGGLKSLLSTGRFEDSAMATS